MWLHLLCSETETNFRGKEFSKAKKNMKRIQQTEISNRRFTLPILYSTVSVIKHNPLFCYSNLSEYYKLYLQDLFSILVI